MDSAGDAGGHTDRSFENTVQNRTLSPCDLAGFAGYLVHVEHRAENLQFFLWYCGYVERWSRLPPEQQRLAPVWGQEAAADTRPTTDLATTTAPPKADTSPALSRRPTVSIHRRSESDKLTRILSILQETVPSRRSLPPTVSSSAAQPCRAEIDRIVRCYIAAAGPRALCDPDLFELERDACLRAARHTTHPSALLPAFLAAEGALRARSFPAFARHWCVANAHGLRLALGRLAAVWCLVVGIALDVVLIVGVPPMLRFPLSARIACLGLWWPALASLLAARHGVDLVLLLRRRRLLRPWERTPASTETDTWKDEEADKEIEAAQADRGAAQPVPIPAWRRLLAELHAAFSFANTTALLDPAVLALQHRAAFMAVLWAGLLSAVAVGASLFIPRLHA